MLSLNIVGTASDLILVTGAVAALAFKDFMSLAASIVLFKLILSRITAHSRNADLLDLCSVTVIAVRGIFTEGISPIEKAELVFQVTE